MSHVSTCNTKIDDKAAIKEVCKDLGVKLSENEVANLGYGNRVKGDLVITLPDKTQVALVWNPKTRVYDVKCDFYSGSVEKLLGGDLRKLKQGHSIKKLERVARQNGFRVTKGKVDQKTGDQELYLYQT